MTISPAQCRAARALLDWTQNELAVIVGVALRTIRDFENGRRGPLKIVRAAIQQAFEEAGVEFLDGEGLRLKRPT
jgi:DNA-binding XRE family transcriptional regulator